MPTKGSDNLFPKLYLEELAADGSETPTPATDYRALFVGEDGAVYLKDAAAAVTEVGGSGSIAAHLADTTDAHDASAISIVDAGGYYTGTDVEAALQEAATASGGVATHLADTTDAHDASAISVADAGGILTATDVEAALAELAALKTGAIEVVIDGGDSAITTGVKLDVEIPFACTLTAARVLLDQSGSIVLDLWKDTYANYPPTVADTITASAKPTVSSATKSQDTTLTGWTVSCAAGDIIRVNVDSITTATRAVLSLRYTR